MPIPGKQVSMTLQSYTKTQNATTGKNEVATATVATFSGKTLQPISAEEALVFNKETTVATHETWIDYYDIGATVAASLTNTNQLVIDSKTYDIVYVKEWDEDVSHHFRVVLRETDVDN